MSNCIVASCNTRKPQATKRGSAVKCFSFPKDPDLKKHWLLLCQVKEDHNKKVCIKHFKEDDFVDGLKARLLGVQPYRLKKDAVPSLFLGPEIIIKEVKQNYTKKGQLRMCTKGPKIKINRPTESSMEYLSKLIPIAPKGQGLKRGTIVVQKSPSTKQKNSSATQKKCSEEPKNALITREVPIMSPKDTTTSLNSIPNIQKLSIAQKIYNKLECDISRSKNMIKQFQPIASHQLKILQHDNAIYKRRINTLLDSQNTLKARIKELEAKVQSEEEDFVNKIKVMFAHVLTSNQVDNILGRRKNTWWTNEEYLKALQLLNISRQAYKYVRDTLKYPLPCSANVNNWYTKHALGRTHPEKKNNKCDENKENSGDDSLMLHDEQMVDDIEVCADVTKNAVYIKCETINNTEYNKYDEVETDVDDHDDYDHVNNIDHNENDDRIYDYVSDIVHRNQVKIEYSNAHDNHTINPLNKAVEYGNDHGNYITDPQNVVAVEYCDHDKFAVNDHIIDEQIFMKDNDQDDIYEEIIIENDYSDDDDEMCDAQEKYTEKDNG